MSDPLWTSSSLAVLFVPEHPGDALARASGLPILSRYRTRETLKMVTGDDPLDTVKAIAEKAGRKRAAALRSVIEEVEWLREAYLARQLTPSASSPPGVPPGPASAATKD